jgi:hypothetical protein
MNKGSFTDEENANVVKIRRVGRRELENEVSLELESLE